MPQAVSSVTTSTETLASQSVEFLPLLLTKSVVKNKRPSSALLLPWWCSRIWVWAVKFYECWLWQFEWQFNLNLQLLFWSLQPSDKPIKGYEKKADTEYCFWEGFPFYWNIPKLVSQIYLEWGNSSDLKQLRYNFRQDFKTTCSHNSLTCSHYFRPNSKVNKHTPLAC